MIGAKIDRPIVSGSFLNLLYARILTCCKAQIMRTTLIRILINGPAGAMKNTRAKFILSSSNMFINIRFYYLLRGLGRQIDIKHAMRMSDHE